ncbi:MAG: flagellar basal body-associated FliL family protein [Gammaproteobacteria bacterium]|nr:flagellar basal body-associated FliL family protein [Gammaproteobacteria bacterium]
MRMSSLPLLLGVLFIVPALPVLGAEGTGAIKPLQYIELKPSIVANMQNGAKYLRTDIQLMTRDDESVEAIKHHAPALRHELFLLISDQEGSKLKDPKGKENFRRNALKSLKKVMLEITGKEHVEELYFSSFFVQ